jgi:DNA repair exonuclease SbcCD ATPase subunit
MNEVKILKLEIVSFKGLRNKVIDFTGSITEIMGDNGTGKSTIMLSFFWLLHRTDDQDRKDFEIQPINAQGEIIHKQDVEVSALLKVNDEKISLKRVFAEKYSKPKGQVEEVYNGNFCTSFYNEVPVSETEYQAKINNIMPKDIFKILTNPLFFCNMKWQDQRQILFSLVDQKADKELAKGNKDFEDLLSKLQGKDLQSFKKEVSAKKRKIKDELDNINPKIEQTNKLMPENADFDNIRKNIASIDERIASIDELITNNTKAMTEKYKQEQEKARQINELINEKQLIELKAKKEATEKAYNLNEKRREKEKYIRDKELEISNYDKDILTCERKIKECNEQIECNKIDHDKIVDRFKTKDNERIEIEKTDFSICPTCNQVMPKGLQAVLLQEKANNVKALNDELDKLEERGKQCNSNIKSYEKEKTNYEKEKEKYILEKDAVNTLLADANKELANMPLIEVKDVDISNNEEYKKLEEEIKKLQDEITTEDKQDDVTKSLKNEKETLIKERDEKKKTLNDEKLINDYKKEIADLERQGKKFAQQIADLEKEEFICSQFIEYKIDSLQEEINSKFSFVKFKLKDKTIEGNIIETCIALINGVPFQAANSASKINAGIDIINALSNKYGYLAPIFIDNKESINRIIDTKAQLIFLSVTKDKELIIK